MGVYYLLNGIRIAVKNSLKEREQKVTNGQFFILFLFNRNIEQQAARY